MSESSAFKNMINPSLVNTMATEIASAHPSFNKAQFAKVSQKFAPLELKARVLLVSAALKEHLPEDYLKALKILIKVMKNDQLSGFGLWPISEYIGQHGLEHFDESLDAMRVLTERFTAEFCVRSYFIKDHQRVLKKFKSWSKDPNVHIRRWVSEGSRPLLPWGARLDVFKNDPTHTIPLLEVLKFDEELYVRKSVANHLNDISKHHPLTVITTLQSWQKNCPPEHQAKLDWIRRQALRTLIKKGDSKALKLMGVGGEAQVKISDLKLNQKKFKVGDSLQFQFTIESTAKKNQKLVVDYAIHFRKKNGQLAAKVFKLKTFELAGKEKLTLQKKHSLKKITTMVYYPGAHKVSVQINGKTLKESKFDLK